jgi:hypothetical protein
MQQAMENPELASELGRKGQLRARALFSRERMIREHMQLYRDVVAPRS